MSYWRSGVTLFEHALASVGGNRDVHEGLGTELLHTRDYPRAESEFRAALADAPNDDALHTGLGTALMQLGDVAGARHEYESAIAANPTNATALRRLGDLTIAEGRVDDAVVLYKRSVAAKRDPSTLAVLAALEGKTDYAISLYRLQPRLTTEVVVEYASISRRCCRAADAIPKRSRSTKKRCADPHQHEALMNFGAVLSRVGRDPDAIAQFNRQRTSGPNRPSRMCTSRWCSRACIATPTRCAKR